MAAIPCDMPPLKLLQSKSGFLFTDPLSQLFSRLEVRYILGRHLHLLARLGITPLTRRTVVQCEAAETANLDTPAARQRGGQRVQNHFNGKFGILDLATNTIVGSIPMIGSVNSTPNCHSWKAPLVRLP